jgi:hypothetical protein
MGCSVMRLSAVGVLCLGLLAMAADAVAYIDPGYGALVQQILLSGFFGALFFGRKLARRLVGRVASFIPGSRPTGSSERPSRVTAVGGRQDLGRKG